MRERRAGARRTGASLGLAALAFAIAGNGLVSAPAQAALARVWQASTAGSFARGTFEGVALDADGKLVLAAPVATWWGPSEGVVWDVAVDGDDGDAAFVATSGPNRLLRITRDEVVPWLEVAGDTLVTAVVSDGRGGAWVGLSAPAKLLHLTGPGQVDVDHALEAGFVWDLLQRGEDVFVAAGAPGGVWRSTAGATPIRLRETGEDPVRALAAGQGDQLWVGTGGRGRVLRLDGAADSEDDADAFVTFDAEEPEVVGLAPLADGTTFVLTAGARLQLTSSSSRSPASRRSSERPRNGPPGNGNGNDGSDGDEDDGDGASRPSAPPTAPRRSSALPRPSGVQGGALYRVEASGVVQQVWTSPGTMPFALVDDGERFIVATGEPGQLHAFDRDGRRARLSGLPSRQASALALAADGSLFVGGTTDARLARLGARSVPAGLWTSPTIDGGTPTRWGRLRWSGEGRPAISIRLGNVDEPDDTWTDWIPLVVGDGSAERIGDPLPIARWAQVRFELNERRGTPSVRSFEVAYRTVNRPPNIESLRVQEPGISWVRNTASSGSATGPWTRDDAVARRVGAALTRRRQGPIRRFYEPGVRTISWAFSDDDGDRLRASLELRSEAGEAWVPIADGLDDEFHSWDTRAVPDGRYRVRLTVHDRLDNVGEESRVDQEISDAFDVDHTRPRLEDIAQRVDGGRRVVSFVATDDGAGIADVEISLDGERWQPLQPEDGVADGPRETYELTIAMGADSIDALQVRVADRVGNVAGELIRLDEEGRRRGR